MGRATCIEPFSPRLLRSEGAENNHCWSLSDWPWHRHDFGRIRCCESVECSTLAVGSLCLGFTKEPSKGSADAGCKPPSLSPQETPCEKPMRAENVRVCGWKTGQDSDARGCGCRETLLYAQWRHSPALAPESQSPRERRNLGADLGPRPSPRAGGELKSKTSLKFCLSLKSTRSQAFLAWPRRSLPKPWRHDGQDRE